MEYNEWYMTGVCGGVEGAGCGAVMERAAAVYGVGGLGREVVCVGKSYVCGLGIPRQAGANALWHLVDKWLESIG